MWTIKSARISIDSAKNYFDVADQQKKVTELTEKQLENQKKTNEEKAKETKTTAEVLKNAKETAAVNKAVSSSSPNSVASGAGGGARWTSKPQPILPDLNLDTGLFKNTANFSLDQQEKLSAGSMEATSRAGGMFDAAIARAKAAGDFQGASYYERRKAEETHQILKDRMSEAGIGNGSKPYTDKSTGGGSGTLSSKVTERGKDPVLTVNDTVRAILDHIKKSLPQHALT